MQRKALRRAAVSSIVLGAAAIALHLSGALPASVLAPLAACGARVGSMHPMQTFGAHARPQLEGVLFAVEGDAAAVRVARGIVRSLGGHPVRIEARHKAAYHCAGSFAAGHVLASLEAGTRLLEGVGFTRKQADWPSTRGNCACPSSAALSWPIR